MTSATQEAGAPSKVVYELQGTLLEACSCNVLCPCWIGEDPDGGTCDAFVAYHFTKGEIDGVDVSGLNIVNIVHIPGNVLTPGSWQLTMFLDKGATQQQRDAIVNAYSGKLGGPLGDLAGLVGEVKAVEAVTIEHSISGGAGKLRIEGVIEAEVEPYRGPDGSVTTLRDSVFSTVPGSPAWVSKAKYNRVTLPKYGYEWSFEGRNAIQADYHISFAQ
ncbi:MAG TPA: DUF1326 domain-containing protein [Candidatus Dormibacteraeota bacterium]|jgi:hypothetical protein|nr:DUF1326 domain-containing protein [Candidatus Dormibacteraeota bacterium]